MQGRWPQCAATLRSVATFLATDSRVKTWHCAVPRPAVGPAAAPRGPQPSTRNDHDDSSSDSTGSESDDNGNGVATSSDDSAAPPSSPRSKPQGSASSHAEAPAAAQEHSNGDGASRPNSAARPRALWAVPAPEGAPAAVDVTVEPPASRAGDPDGEELQWDYILDAQERAVRLRPSRGNKRKRGVEDVSGRWPGMRFAGVTRFRRSASGVTKWRCTVHNPVTKCDTPPPLLAV